ncbi:MAG TPA: hypothetical protein DDZ99_00085, partial [Clostridiales bacterium]|nr:hypothetical protein [Clostridiales bacterium]
TTLLYHDNYTYGYLGAAYGFSYDELLFGSFYAAGFPTQDQALTNEILDWQYINLGYFDVIYISY